MPTMARLGRWAGLLMLGVLFVMLTLHVGCVCLDFIAGIRYPYQFDYGEGIVWQQAALIPGPRMYGLSPELPFIVFHYPPLYHLATRAAALFMPDMLAAGRLVSGVSSVLIGVLISGLVLVAGRRPGGCGGPAVHLAIALAAGGFALCLHAVRTWGLYMRVDMLAIAFGLAGMLVACWSNAGLRGTTVALLLCVASVYCKQTQLPAGMAVFLVVLLRRPRIAVAAGAIALGAGLLALIAMQVATGGGFLHNIVGDNVNRFEFGQGLRVLRSEQASAGAVALIGVSACIAIFTLRSVAWPPTPRALLKQLRAADRALAARAMLLVHFVLATLMLVTIFKSGSSYNYLAEWLCVGCALIGVAACALADSGWRLLAIAALMAACLVGVPFRQLPDQFPQAFLDHQAAIVQAIAAADKPVASDEMTLLMRAGKPVVYEPAIATELAWLGKWDETPLVAMIRAGGFAFMITTDDESFATLHRTPAVNAAMRDAYPVVEQVDRRLWFHLPASPGAPAFKPAP